MADETKRKTADETENPLQTMTEQWMQLERKTTKQREAADLFYEKKLMNLIEDNFIARNRERVEEEVEYLIMSVGTSYEPLVLSIKLLNPQKILFLCTAIKQNLKCAGIRKFNVTMQIDFLKNFLHCLFQYTQHFFYLLYRTYQRRHKNNNITNIPYNKAIFPGCLANSPCHQKS